MIRDNDIDLRRRAERRGRRGELLASFILMLKGYRILGRRIRTHVGEIDLVARAPSGVLCFVEVKAREFGELAIAAVKPRQQMRIARAAQAYLLQRPELGANGVRFDIVTFSARGFLKHVPDAWRP
jgi:putative endonuclease